jgi:Cd2+/Zn2+-exporting ATPase
MDGSEHAAMDGETMRETETLSWRVEGMDCGACVAKVEKAVSRLNGVSEISVNLMAERLTLRRDPGGADATAIETQISALGYRASRITAPPASTPETPHSHHSDDHDHDHAHGHHHDEEPGVAWWRTGKARLLFGLAVLAGAAWLLAHALPAQTWWIYPLATLAAVTPFARRALALARAGSPFSIETLMCVAALGAVAIGAAEEAAVVVVLFAAGELLETVAAGQARAGIRALATLIPRTARVERDGTAIEVAAETLAIGDVVQVRPGDRVPCDGAILEGHSALDESPVTGESIPVARGPGDAVLAGSVNADAGLLRIRVTHAASDNTVARIVRLVEEASASRAPTQRFVERFAEIWTPAAMAISALVVLVPPLLLGGDWWVWTYRGLALLLIACPCALVISVPAAVASGLSAGARRGLLVKGGAALEALGAARTVAFDKTGTLTQGRPVVRDVLAFGGRADGELLRLAAAVEQGSAHPLGRAILERAAADGLALPQADAMRGVPGRAVQAQVEGRQVVVCSPTHLTEIGLSLDEAAAIRLEALEAAGMTVVAVAADREILGLLAIRDEPRPDAAAGLAALRAMGLDVVMLTGDNPRTAAAIAGDLGIAVKAGLLPADKLREIAGLRAAGLVVMVGDGINDAPALAAASVGVAMGGGTDVALEAADAALLGQRVGGVAELVGLSRATLSNIRQNVGVALGLKAVFLVTTLAGLTGLWPAILADTGATVLVTLNALRLLGWKPGA